MAEVIIPVSANDSVFYDPDTNTPDTSVLQFPLAADSPEGSRIKLQNKTLSFTPIIYRGQGGDTISSPTEVTDFQTEQSVIVPELIVEYQRVGTQWRLVGHGDPDLANAALNAFCYAAYGGLYLATPPVAALDFDAGYTKITAFDTGSVAVPRGIVQNIANDSLQITQNGVYIISLYFAMSHAESNQGRTLYLRFYNETDALQVGNPIPVGIARNQPVTTISYYTLYELPIDVQDKDIILQIGGGDAITTISILSANWQISSVGEYRGNLYG